MRIQALYPRIMWKTGCLGLFNKSWFVKEIACVWSQWGEKGDASENKSICWLPPVSVVKLLHGFPRKGYRTDATVSVFLGFLLFLIPAKKPSFGKKAKGMKASIWSNICFISVGVSIQNRIHIFTSQLFVTIILLLPRLSPWSGCLAGHETKFTLG